MIDPVTGLFEIMQYNDNKSMKIANLVETMWMDMYPWLVNIKYDQGEGLIGHDFINTLIEINMV